MAVYPLCWAGGAGLIFTPCCEPYLSSEYGPDYVSESPVKLLDALMHGVKKSQGEEIVVLSQVRPRAVMARL